MLSCYLRKKNSQVANLAGTEAQTVGSTAPIAIAPAPAQYKCITPENLMKGKYTPVKVSKDKNIECMSRDGKECVWSGSEAECQKSITAGGKNEPLVCGPKFAEVYGMSGYHTRGHWCQVGQKLLGSPKETLPPAPEGPKVSLYMGKDFTGPSMEVGAGWVTACDGDGIPLFEHRATGSNKVNSVKVPQGYKVELYRDCFVQGKESEMEVLTADTKAVKIHGDVSRVHITGGPLCDHDGMPCTGGCACGTGKWIGPQCKNEDPCFGVECKNGGLCKNGECACTEKFRGKDCTDPNPCFNVKCKNGGVCREGVCVCPSGYTGPDCGGEVPCKKTDCKNGGLCRDGKCHCTEAFRGPHCDQKNPCFGKVCQNGGVCEEGVCVCPRPYWGDACENKDICAGVTCENGGVCGNGKCVCPPPFEGEKCEKSNLCYGVKCLNDGACKDGKCVCPPRWKGCKCDVEDKCWDVKCLNGGVCQDGKCICPYPFIGEKCEKKDPCAGVTCLNKGVCQEGKCVCPSPYSGPKCENKDKCDGKKCLNFGVCQNGECRCPPPFTGGNCENIDPCFNVKCENGGVCKQGKCVCKRGWKGCKCNEPDECAKVDCKNGGICQNGECACKAPYLPPNCTDVDPCYQVDCKYGGVCVAGKCVCPSGYIVGPDGKCKPDLCKGVTCLNGGLCVNGNCACPPRWNGLPNDRCANPDKCYGVECQNGGKCCPATGKCVCKSCYSGDTCQTYDPCCGVQCQHFGKCKEGKCQCVCGWGDANCQTRQKVELYPFEDFKGTPLIVGDGVYTGCDNDGISLKDLDRKWKEQIDVSNQRGNNLVKSIKIPCGYIVTVYEACKGTEDSDTKQVLTTSAAKLEFKSVSRVEVVSVGAALPIENPDFADGSKGTADVVPRGWKGDKVTTVQDGDKNWSRASTGYGKYYVALKGKGAYIQQEISGLTVGSTYEVEFLVSAPPKTAAASLQVLVDDKPQKLLFDDTKSGNASDVGQVYSFKMGSSSWFRDLTAPFKAEAPNVMLTFKNASADPKATVFIGRVRVG